MKSPWYYYICYMYSKGFGHTRIERDGPIKTMDDIIDIEKYIEKNIINGEQVIIINWRSIRK